jgi:thioredoxin-like negative regulator of GroEL
MTGTVSHLLGLVAAGVISAVGSAADPTIAWQTDYAAAMKEAEKKKLPVLVVIGTDACTHCRRLEAETLKDERVKAALVGQFVTLKIDGNKEVALVNALRVQVYPTCVLAGPDGRIHGYLQGYQDADELRTALAKAAAEAAKK